MARKNRNYSRHIEPDPKYKSTLVSQFVNYLMLEGKKTLAERIVYEAFDIVKKETGEDPLAVFTAAIKNGSPMVEVRSKRVGGANYQVPVEVRAERRTALVFRWTLNFARKKKGKPMSKRLAEEIVDAYNKTGSIVKKKEDTHRMAEANRAFAHFR
jgi:small subunit ribosomal protein S7